MKKTQDLRKTLSRNIRKIRKSLHISQAKLAEYVGISAPYMMDIEYCKTWVSDSTLDKIARALNMEPYELLIPEKTGRKAEPPGALDLKDAGLMRVAGLIKAKRTQLRRNAGEIMDDLIMEIIKTHADNH